MSQLSKFLTSSGPGSGTVTSITFNGGLTSTPDPVTTTGTATIDQTNLTVLDGTVYWDTGTQLLHTTATGTAGWVLTSNGAGAAPSYQAAPGATLDFDGDTGTANPLAGVINFKAQPTSGSSVIFAASSNTVALDVTDIDANTLIGEGAGNLTLSGSNNTGLGDGVLAGLTTGSSNTAVGLDALADLQSGSSNTALGSLALDAILTGANNIGIGASAGSGYVTSESSNIVIGAAGTTGESHVLRLGTNGSGAGQQNKCYVAGIDGVNVGSVATVVTEASNQLGTAVITAGTGISITPGANTITIATTGSTNPVTTLHTQDGNNVTATAGVINISGGNNLTTTGTAGPNTATISLSGITQHSLQVGGASNALTQLGVATNGQLPIGSTGADPVLATITAGSGISVTNGAGSITIANTATSGALVLLQTQVASSSANIVFSSTYITSTYLNYRIIFTSVQPSTNANLNMDMSTNNGSTYLNSGYECGILTTSWNGTTNRNTNSTTTCPLNDGAGMLQTTTYTSGEIDLYGLATTSGWPIYTGRSMQNGNAQNIIYGTQAAGSTAINNIRFQMSTGNIATGTFSLYGIAK